MNVSKNFNNLTKAQKAQVKASLDESIKKVEQNTARKLKRLANKGIKNVENIDPRRPGEITRKYTLVQKQSYLNRLNEFNSISNKPLVSSKNEALNPDLYNKYVKIAKSVNARANKQMKPYANKLLPDLTNANPNSRVTVKDRTNKMMDHMQKTKMYNPAVNPLGVNISKPSHFTNQEALEEAIEKLINKDNDFYIDKRHSEAIRDMNEMAKEMGGHGNALKKEVTKLTPTQFDILWNFTGFANAASTAYEIVRAWNIDEDLDHKKMFDNEIREARVYIDWVKENIK